MSFKVNGVAMIDTTELDIDISPEAVADLFWNFDDAEQARFFNHLGKTAEKLENQMLYLKDSSDLEVEGIRAVKAISIILR